MTLTRPRHFLTLTLMLCAVAVLPSTLHALGFHPQTAADTTGHAEPGTWPLGAGLWGSTFLALWQLVVPGITAWLFKLRNTADGALSRLPNWIKQAVYILGTTVVLQIAKFVTFGLPADAHNWTPALIIDLLTAIVGTVLVKLGINTQKEKA